MVEPIDEVVLEAYNYITPTAMLEFEVTRKKILKDITSSINYKFYDEANIIYKKAYQGSKNHNNPFPEWGHMMYGALAVENFITGIIDRWDEDDYEKM